MLFQFVQGKIDQASDVYSLSAEHIHVESKKKKLTNWTVENTIEKLMANQFKK